MSMDGVPERRRVRVLVAEDSVAMQTMLTTLLGEDPYIEVVGCAADGMQAVEMARSLRPDVITMDILMPHLDGVEATAAIMASVPARVLIVSSVADSKQVDLTFRAISAGALEVIGKPTSQRPEALDRWGERLREAVHLMAEVPVITRRHRRPHTASGRRVDAVGLVASTGGPPALARVLGALPADLPIPLLVAQHIADGFVDGLVRWLSGISPLRVVVASDGTVPSAGHVYFPADRRDLELDADGVMRLPPPLPGGHTPSGDRLLLSMAKVYGNRAAGVIMTGMGDDGAAGLLAIREAGGVTLAQSQSSCVVFGMPQAAILRGATSDILPLEGLIEEIRALAYRRP